MDTVAPAPQPAPRKRLRWVRGLGLTTALVVVGLIAAAPTIVSKSPELRNRLVRRFMGDLKGDITISRFSVGWFEPLEIEGLALLPHADSQPVPGSSANREPLVTAARIESDRDLWRMLWYRADVGTIRIERPEVFLALGEKGHSNFSEVFRPILEREAKTPSSLKFGARAQIVDGTLRGFSAETREPWQITGINLAVGVRSAELSKSGKPELYVEKGNLVSKGDLTVGLCNDVLKYVAPVVAKVARARGTVSIDLDDWRLPWKDFATGELSGRVTMNSVDVGPGTMTENILTQIAALPMVGDWMRARPLPEFVNIARDSVITFKMIPGGRIQHEGLRFSLADLIDVQSHGTVGLDETLDLVATLGIHPPNPEERKLALMRQLSTQQWPINIRGKLGAPEIDLSPIGVAWKQLLFQKVPADWLSGRNSVGGNLLGGIAQKLLETGAIPPEAAGGILSQLQPPPGYPTPPAPGPRTLDPNGPTLGPSLGPADAGATPSLVNPSAVNSGAGNPGATNPTGALPPPPPPTALPTGTPPPGFNAADGVKLGLDVLSAIRAHRQQQQRPQLIPPGTIPLNPYEGAPPGAAYGPGAQNGPGPANPQAYGPNGSANTLPNGAGPYGAGPDPASTVPPPRRPLLRQGLRALLDAATQPTPPAQPPTGQSPTGTTPPAAQPPSAQPPAAEAPAPANRAP